MREPSDDGTGRLAVAETAAPSTTKTTKTNGRKRRRKGRGKGAGSCNVDEENRTDVEIVRACNFTAPIAATSLSRLLLLVIIIFVVVEDRDNRPKHKDDDKSRGSASNCGPRELSGDDDGLVDDEIAGLSGAEKSLERSGTRHLRRWLNLAVGKSARFVAVLSTIVLVASLFLVAFGTSGGSSWQARRTVLLVEAYAGGPVKYSTRVVQTRYGALRGIVTRDNDLEAFLGVPYATPPLGALRYTPPVTPTQWRDVRFADSMPPPCPQRAASGSPKRDTDSSSSIAAHSEDCLYLNLYVPRTAHGINNNTELLPTLLLVHGDSYSHGAGNSLVGTGLAAHGRLVVVSINFRLGILGFLKTGSRGSGQGNYGLMDLVAGLHWLHENLEAFGGDPGRISVLGHGTGAALANLLAVSPMAGGLIERVVLLGGSALSPWAIQRDPLAIKRRVAEQTGCPSNVETDDIAACLRLRSLDELLDVRLDSPRFTRGFAPFVDGTVLPLSASGDGNIQPTMGSSGLLPMGPVPGVEFASFGDRRLLLGLTSDEAWLDLNDEDVRNGLNETRRDRILRTYVRNTYRYHLREIYSTLRNEYTDWETGEQSPAGIRDGLLALLGDGQVAAPLLRLALLHSASGARGYFVHFQPGDRPSRRGEELPYLLGIPMLRNQSADLPSIAPVSGNYTGPDENLSRLLVRYLANFVRRGDPNDDGGANNIGDGSPPFWDSYDSINQYYLEAGASSARMRSHYRGHKMSLWLNLLPQLHRPGYETNMRHHHLPEGPSLYEGAVRPRTIAVPISAPPPLPTIPSPTSQDPTTLVISHLPPTECPPDVGIVASSYPTIRPTDEHDYSSKLGPGPNDPLRKFASNHYQSYTTALTVTIAVGVFLLLLNILIFAGIYHQRDRNQAIAATSSGSSSTSMGFVVVDGAKEEPLGAGCSGRFGIISSSDSRLSSSSPPLSKRHHHQQPDLELEEFERSPPPGSGAAVRMSSSIDPPAYGWTDRPRTPSPCVDVAAGNNADEDDDEEDEDEDDDEDDEDLPDPPPPPRAPAPNVSACPGILRQPGTPGSAKKRVQIQEISV